MGRVRYATRNIIFGFLGSGATTLLNFILRQVFITHLGDTLLGVQDLYSEILTMLSLAELGVGTALNYSLYGPVARGEREKITLDRQKCRLSDFKAAAGLLSAVSVQYGDHVFCCI